MELINVQAILLSGIILGSLYSLMGIGLSMIWGTVRMFNFAHGSLMMLGAYVAWTVIENTEATLGSPWHLVIGIVVTIGVLISAGMALERLLIHPFLERRNADILAVITTLAGMLFLDNAAHIIWGPRMKRLPPLIRGQVGFLGTNISTQELFVILLSPTLIVLIALFLKRFKLGFAIRAVEQNRDSAQLVGINVSAIYMVTFGIAAGMAAMAGILMGSIRIMTPTMGASPLLKAFIVVILGGLGSMMGTMIGAYIIGLLEAISTFFLGLYWTPAVLFLVMIVALLVKPTGLLGEAE